MTEEHSAPPSAVRHCFHILSLSSIVMVLSDAPPLTEALTLEKLLTLIVIKKFASATIAPALSMWHFSHPPTLIVSKLK